MKFKDRTMKIKTTRGTFVHVEEISPLGANTYVYRDGKSYEVKAMALITTYKDEDASFHYHALRPIVFDGGEFKVEMGE